MVHRDRNYNPKERARTIDQQIVNMRANFPNFECKRSRNKATWIGLLQPTPSSNSYKVEIKYQVGDIPRVFVRAPALETRRGENKIPHTYSKNEICVYLPGSNEWRPTMFIADTIIPWTSVWFFYYETWLATGKWCGGGTHPEKRTPYIKSDTEKSRRDAI